MLHTHTPYFGLRNSWKKFLCIIHTYFLEFVSAKFNRNFSVCSIFYWFILTKNKNLYRLHYVLKQIYTVFTANKETC